MSGRFLSDLFAALERQGIAAGDLLGDLPISLGEHGEVREAVEWAHFADFMKRLEHRVAGPNGLETCGEQIAGLAPAAALRSLAGAAASPYALYYAASQWALRRAMPGITSELIRVDDGHLEIVARIADGLRACPQIFHFATGGARGLPRLIGLSDAVVTASIGEREARYRIAVPPSRSVLARLKRLGRAVFSSGSILHYLEAQQLELHAKNDALQRAHDALAASERRYRAFTDAAVDVLCEIDAAGRIVYVSASVQDLIGYTPEQVTNSHYRLWIPSDFRQRATAAFDRLFFLPEGRAVQELVWLHTSSGGDLAAEMTARAYAAPDGDRRIVCVLRDVSERGARTPAHPVRPRDPRARLREHLSRPDGDASPPHALERSLDQLLARLDEWVGASPSAQSVASPALDEATRRISRIVEAAVARSTETGAGFQWTETHKLLGSVRDAFWLHGHPSAGPEAGGVEIQIELGLAPSEIWTRPDLLDCALTSLLDWAADRTTSGGADGAETSRVIRLRAEAIAERRHSGGVVLTVERPSPEPRDGGDTEGSAPSSLATLALAIAADAVEGLGGRLVQRDGSAGAAWLIHLPSPPAGSRGARPEGVSETESVG